VDFNIRSRGEVSGTRKIVIREQQQQQTMKKKRCIQILLEGSWGSVAMVPMHTLPPKKPATTIYIIQRFHFDFHSDNCI
jgi:hypothetical protein